MIGLECREGPLEPWRPVKFFTIGRQTAVLVDDHGEPTWFPTQKDAADCLAFLRARSGEDDFAGWRTREVRFAVKGSTRGQA